MEPLAGVAYEIWREQAWIGQMRLALRATLSAIETSLMKCRC